MESGFKTFLKRRLLLIGGLAAILPLLAVFFLQYRTLKTLGQTLPAYRKSLMTQHLREVVEKVYDHYVANAKRVLDVPATSLELGSGAVIRDDEKRLTSLRAVARAADHFKGNEFKGARRYFIAIATELNGAGGGEIFLYDPARQAMVHDPKAPEMTALNVACSSYFIYIRRSTRMTWEPVGVDRDPNHRLVVKAIYDKPSTDKTSKLIAVAGMILDDKYLMESLLPETIREVTPRFLPDEAADALISLRGGQQLFALYDGMGAALKPSEQEAKIENEVYQPFYMVFVTLRLSLRLKASTVEQWARRNFIFNLSLWGVMAALVLAGIALMLRTASREMKLTQTKADFVSNVSHELRTPLASIRVLAELLNLGRVSEPGKVREYGGYIESEGRRLTQLINNILDFSRIESGRKAFNFERMDLREVVSETVQAFSLQLKRNGFAIEYDAPPGDQMPVVPVMMDADAISLALSNLLDNAIKYSRETRRIGLRLERENGFATIAVADRGIGIDREEQEKIFDKFYRVSTGLVHDVKGSGLGLSLVRHIVEAHRGKVTVESEPGQGSTFTIHLPVASTSGENSK